MRIALESTDEFVDFTGYSKRQIIELMLPEEFINEHITLLSYDEESVIAPHDDYVDMTFVYDTFDPANINLHYMIIFKFKGYSVADGQLCAGLMALTISGLQHGDWDDGHEPNKFEKIYTNVLLTEASPIGLSKMLDRYNIRDEVRQLVTTMMA
jgi:hypothetical protein